MWYKYRAIYLFVLKRKKAKPCLVKQSNIQGVGRRKHTETFVVMAARLPKLPSEASWICSAFLHPNVYSSLGILIKPRCWYISLLFANFPLLFVNHVCPIRFYLQVRVNGPDTAPLYKFLKEKKSGFLGSRIKWNFTKFLVNKEGLVIQRYGPTATPFSFEVLSLPYAHSI